MTCKSKQVVLQLSLILSLTVAAGSAAAKPQPLRFEPRLGIVNCNVTHPTGDYALAILELTIPGDPKNTDRSKRQSQRWTYVGGVRKGRMRVDDGVGLRKPGGWIEFKGAKVTGRFHRADLGKQITVEASIIQNAIRGTAKFGDRNAIVSGRFVSEAELARTNAVAADKWWPASQGPLGGGCSAQWTGVPTIDDSKDLRMVWRCEETDIGRGMGNISRFMVIRWKDASSRRTGSGCASPLVAEGKVFFKYFVPAQGDPNQEIREYMIKANPPATGYTRATPTLAAQSLLKQAEANGFKEKPCLPMCSKKHGLQRMMSCYVWTPRLVKQFGKRSSRNAASTPSITSQVRSI